VAEGRRPVTVDPRPAAKLAAAARICRSLHGADPNSARVPRVANPRGTRYPAEFPVVRAAGCRDSAAGRRRVAPGPQRGRDRHRGTSMSDYRRIDVSKEGDVTIVKFLDKKILDETGVQELGVELFRLVEHDNRKQILLNFENVEFLSSAALGKLITLDRKTKAARGRLKMSNIRPEILEVLQITKLNKVFDIRADQAEAIAAF